MKLHTFKNLLYLLITSFCMSAIAISPDDLNVKIEKTMLDQERFQCDLTIRVPDGYKLPKAPDISISKLKNLKNFRYRGEGKIIADSVRKISFSVSIDNPHICGGYLELSLDCPVCKDICHIISKNIFVDFCPQQQKSHKLWFFLFLGFIGGVLLNIMPCVFPIILLKLKAFRSRTAILGSIAGNYIAFMSFAICISVLKITGNVVGWGLHFQNHIFLEIVTIYLFLLTLYSFGKISIASPSFQIKDNSKRQFYGNAVSSVIACVIAIPCTAPFLGTATVFALQGSVFDLCSVFFAIASGFSAPYLLSLFISVRINEKVGKFSELAKNIINCGALIAFLWIFWLLSNHLSREVLLLHLTMFSASTMFFIKKRNIIAFILICIPAIVALPAPEGVIQNSEIMDLIDSKLTQNRVIVFNISADWCLTCKYNKRVIFRDTNVMRVMKDYNVEYIEKDLTKKNDSLMNFILAHHRAGIPFTIVYGPNAKSGILLGEIPSSEETINAIQKAASIK